MEQNTPPSVIASLIMSTLCKPLEGKHTLFAGKTHCECGAVKLVNATLGPPVTFHHSFSTEL